MGHRLQPNPVAGPALADTDPLPPITVEDLARTDAGEADERRPRPGLDPPWCTWKPSPRPKPRALSATPRRPALRLGRRRRPTTGHRREATHRPTLERQERATPNLPAPPSDDLVPAGNGPGRIGMGVGLGRTEHEGWCRDLADDKRRVGVSGGRKS